MGGGGRERHLRALSRSARGHRDELDRQQLSCAERAGVRLRSRKVSTDRHNSTRINLAEQQHSIWRPRTVNREPRILDTGLTSTKLKRHHLNSNPPKSTQHTRQLSAAKINSRVYTKPSSSRLPRWPELRPAQRRSRPPIAKQKGPNNLRRTLPQTIFTSTNRCM